MADDKKRPLVIGFEGNIGAGKSTLIRKLSRRLGEKGFVFGDAALKCPHLEKFYKEPSAENAYLVQKWVADERKAREYPTDVPIILVDRTTMSDVVFTMVGSELMGKEKTMDLLDRACENTDIEEIDVTLFLDTPIQTCLENIAKRGRKMEEDIRASYLQKISDGYDKVFEKLTREDDPIVIPIPYGDPELVVDLWVALAPFLLGDVTAEETVQSLRKLFSQVVDE